MIMKIALTVFVVCFAVYLSMIFYEKAVEEPESEWWPIFGVTNFFLGFTAFVVSAIAGIWS